LIFPFTNSNIATNTNLSTLTKHRMQKPIFHSILVIRTMVLSPGSAPPYL